MKFLYESDSNPLFFAREVTTAEMGEGWSDATLKRPQGAAAITAICRWNWQIGNCCC
jgi:hypothetical protein